MQNDEDAFMAQKRGAILLAPRDYLSCSSPPARRRWRRAGRPPRG